MRIFAASNTRVAAVSYVIPARQCTGNCVDGSARCLCRRLYCYALARFRVQLTFICAPPQTLI